MLVENWYFDNCLVEEEVEAEGKEEGEGGRN